MSWSVGTALELVLEAVWRGAMELSSSTGLSALAAAATPYLGNVAMDVFFSFSRTGLSPVSLSLADSISLVESVAVEVEGMEVAFDGSCGPLF